MQKRKTKTKKVSIYSSFSDSFILINIGYSRYIFSKKKKKKK